MPYAARNSIVSLTAYLSAAPGSTLVSVRSVRFIASFSGVLSSGNGLFD